MDAPIYDGHFNSLTFGVETTIGYYDFSDEAVTEEKVGHQFNEADYEKAEDKTWIGGDELVKNLPFLVGFFSLKKREAYTDMNSVDDH